MQVSVCVHVDMYVSGLYAHVSMCVCMYVSVCECVYECAHMCLCMLTHLHVEAKGRLWCRLTLYLCRGWQ